MVRNFVEYFISVYVLIFNLQFYENYLEIYVQFSNQFTKFKRIFNIYKYKVLTLNLLKFTKENSAEI